MQITKEGEKWLAPQKVAAAYFGVSVVAFQRWNYEPVRKEGRSKLYDVRAIQDDLDDRFVESKEDLDLTAERARLAKEQADKTEMENEVRRGELVEAESIIEMVGNHIQSVKTKLMALPSQISSFLAHKEVGDINGQLTDALHDALTELSEGAATVLDAAKKTKNKPVGRRGKKAK